MKTLLAALLLVPILSWAEPPEKTCVYYASFAKEATFARDGKLSPKAKDLSWYIMRLQQEAPSWGINEDVLGVLYNIASWVYTHPDVGGDEAFNQIMKECLIQLGNAKEI